MPAPHDVYNDAKRLYVVHAKSPEEIAPLVGKSASTVYKWASETDPHGRTWRDLREAERDARYESASPRAIAAKIIERMGEIVNAETFDTKAADAVAKLQRSLDRIVDSSYQVPVMFEMLEGLVLHLKEHHPDLLSVALVAAVRDYKNHLRERLEV